MFADVVRILRGYQKCKVVFDDYVVRMSRSKVQAIVDRPWCEDVARVSVILPLLEHRVSS